MELTKFKTGDLVKLKSGERKMTVLSYQKISDNLPPKVLCNWFENGRSFTQPFSEDEIEKIE